MSTRPAAWEQSSWSMCPLCQPGFHTYALLISSDASINHYTATDLHHELSECLICLHSIDKRCSMNEAYRYHTKEINISKGNYFLVVHVLFYCAWHIIHQAHTQILAFGWSINYHNCTVYILQLAQFISLSQLFTACWPSISQPPAQNMHLQPVTWARHLESCKTALMASQA